MLNRLFKRLKKNSKSNAIYDASHHPIRNEDLSSAVLRVTRGLQDEGFAAYLVGGGVRDLLLDGHPKDFDVATDATPEDVVKVFKRARIIGRRFKIVHVRFGKEIIEVTTFRGHHKEGKKKGEAKQSDKGILLRDNVYGDIESDALRRDFTINALYYDPSTREIHDFTDGVEDIDNRTIKMIGDPDDRYKEDPVRMLRALRFAAKLDFDIDPATDKPIREHADYLSHIPAARLFEEVLKLFMSGYAADILPLLKDYGLMQYLLPSTDACLEKGPEHSKKLVLLAARNTDRRIKNNQRVTPAFIYAAVLWPAVQAEMESLVNEQGMAPQEALQQASQGIVSQQLSFTTIPKRFLIPMREIWTLQLRLPRRQGRRAYQLMEHPRFRAAYDFFLLREESGEELQGVGEWWTQFQNADHEGKETLVNQLGKPRHRNQRRRRKPQSNAS